MRRTKRAILESAVLPVSTASLAALVTAVNNHKTKSSTKDKVKKLVRNAALGAIVGGGLEAGRLGITNLLSKHDLGDVTVNGNFIES